MKKWRLVRKLSLNGWILWLAGGKSLLNHVEKEKIGSRHCRAPSKTHFSRKVRFKSCEEELSANEWNRFCMESCCVASLFTRRNSLDEPASSGEAAAVREHQWDGGNGTPEFVAPTRQTDTEGEGETADDPHSRYSHASVPEHVIVESNPGSCQAIKDSGWLKRGLTGGAATFSMFIVPRNLSNLAGSFIRLFFTRARTLLGVSSSVVSGACWQ